MRLLLDRETDVHAHGEYHGNVLQAAAANGHEEVVWLLLERDANVNTQVGEHDNALQATTAKGHEAVVRPLLERDTDARHQVGWHAAADRKETIMRLLLQRDMKINTQEERFSNALQACSSAWTDARSPASFHLVPVSICASGMGRESKY